MGIILDLIILAIMILSIILGYKKGLVGVIYNLCAFFIAIVVTIILYRPITNLVLDKTQIDENIKSTIIENGVIKEDEESQEVYVNTYIQKYLEDTITDTSNDIIKSTADVVSEKIVSIIVAIALFIVVRIILIFLKFIIEGIASLPIIKQFNEFGGIAYGILRGLIIIYALLAILFFVVSINNNGFIAEIIESSIISKFLYANNLILKIIL